MRLWAPITMVAVRHKPIWALGARERPHKGPRMGMQVRQIGEKGNVRKKTYSVGSTLPIRMLLEPLTRTVAPVRGRSAKAAARSSEVANHFT